MNAVQFIVQTSLPSPLNSIYTTCGLGKAINIINDHLYPVIPRFGYRTQKLKAWTNRFKNSFFPTDNRLFWSLKRQEWIPNLPVYVIAHFLIWLYLTLSLFSFTLADVLVYGVICLDRTQNKVLHCTCDDNNSLVNEIPKCFFFYEWLLQYWVLLRRTIKWQLYNNHISFYNSYFIPVICWLYLCYHFPMNVSCISQSTNIHSIAVNWYGICLQQLHRFNRFSQYCTDFWCLRKSVRMLNKTV